MKRNNAETGIQRAIIDGLRMILGRHYLVFHIPNGGVRSPIEAGIMKGMIEKGAADVLIAGCGFCGFLEVKDGKGKQDAGQVEFEANCKARSIPYSVARSLDEACAAIIAWGIAVRSRDGALRPLPPPRLEPLERKEDCAERAGGGDSSRLPGVPGVRGDSAMEGKG